MTVYPVKFSPAENCTKVIEDCYEYDVVHIMYVYVLTGLVAMGIILNTISFLVFTFQAAKFKYFGAFVMFLRHLAVSDLLFLFFISPLGACRCTEAKNEEVQHRRNIYLAYLFTPFVNTFAAVSVWITTTLTIERFVAITRITSARIELSAKQINMIVACFYTGSFLLNMFFFFEARIEDGEIVYTDFALSLAYDIWFWTRAFLAKYIPIVVVIVVNVCILIALCIANRQHMRLMKNQEGITNTKKKTFTKSVPLLLAVSLTFAVCHSLEPLVYTNLFGPCNEFAYHVTVLLVNLLETLAASTNFIFYCAFNAEFRLALRGLCVRQGNKINPKAQWPKLKREHTTQSRVETQQNS